MLLTRDAMVGCLVRAIGPMEGAATGVALFCACSSREREGSREGKRSSLRQVENVKVRMNQR